MCKLRNNAKLEDLDKPDINGHLNQMMLKLGVKDWTEASIEAH